jgi:hypothetical protein
MTTWTIEREVHFEARARGRKGLRAGTQPPGPAADPGRVPRVARLMALALRLESLRQAGAVKDYAEIARLGHVTRARVSQVMNLLYLAPDLQEAVLFLPRTLRGRDPIPLWRLLPIAATPDWRQQRRLWARLLVQDHATFCTRGSHCSQP